MEWLRSLCEYHARRFLSQLDRAADVVVDTFERVFQSIGEWIREIRYANGLTQEKLAELLDVDPRTVQRWEADEQVPRNRMLYQLQRIGDVSVTGFITESTWNVTLSLMETFGDWVDF